MNDRNCPNCNSQIPADAPLGLCPQCILAGARAEQADPLMSTSAGPGTFVAPGPQSLDGKFPNLSVEALIGHGGMGAVYRARQNHLDRVVALKVLAPNLGSDPSFAERFTREARTLAKLSHPSIITVFEFGEVDELFYLVMEFVDGINLRQAIRSGELTASEALQIVPQVCEALQYAHDEGVVHRDIKPENILLNTRGQIKIADFGLAKLLDRPASDFTLTATHQVMGTRNYMAPEQIEKPGQVDHRADIYSLGVVFYELLTGELPIGRFAAPSEKASVGSDLDEVVFRTLEKEPVKRFQQASDFKTAVEQVQAPRSLQRTPESPPTSHAAAHSDQRSRPSSFTAQPGGDARAHHATTPPTNPTNTYVPFTIGELQAGFATAYGIAKTDGHQLILEYDVHNELGLEFGRRQSKRVHTAAIAVTDIVDVNFKEGFWGGTLRIVTNSVASAQDIPKSKQGSFELRITKHDYKLARNFTATLQAALDRQSHRPPQPVTGKPALNKSNAPAGVAAHLQPGIKQPGANHTADSTADGDHSESLGKLKTITGYLNLFAIFNLVFSAGPIIKLVTTHAKGPADWIAQIQPVTQWDPNDHLIGNLASMIADVVSAAVNPLWGNGWILTVIVSILLLVATAQMKQFRNYQFCMAIVLVMLLPVYKLYFFGLGLGIWALVVLLDADVKQRFERVARRRNPQNATVGKPALANELGNVEAGSGNTLAALGIFFFVGCCVLMALSVLYVALQKRDAVGTSNETVNPPASQLDNPEQESETNETNEANEADADPDTASSDTPSGALGNPDNGTGVVNGETGASADSD